MSTQQSIGRTTNSLSSMSQLFCFSLMFSENKSLTGNLGEAVFSLWLQLWTSNPNLHCDNKTETTWDDPWHKTALLAIPSVCNTVIPAHLDKCSVVFGIVEPSSKNWLPSQRSCSGQARIVISHCNVIDRFGDFPWKQRKLVSKFGTETFQCVGTPKS